MSSGIKIQIRTSNKGVISLNVNITDTTRSLKLKIEKETGIAVSSQRLLYRGKELKYDTLIGDFGVNDGAIMQLAVIKKFKPVMYVSLIYIIYLFIYLFLN